MKKSPTTLFVFGAITIVVMLYLVKTGEPAHDSVTFWIYRVVTALAASAISVSIPGMLAINYTPKGEVFKDDNGDLVKMSLADKEPTITASGAIAVFVLVYLVSPSGMFS